MPTQAAMNHINRLAEGISGMVVDKLLNVFFYSCKIQKRRKHVEVFTWLSIVSALAYLAPIVLNIFVKSIQGKWGYVISDLLFGSFMLVMCFIGWCEFVNAAVKDEDVLDV